MNDPTPTDSASALGPLIGVVSDTHGQTSYARAAARMLAEFDLQCVVHCGDIGSPSIVDIFGPWQTHYVFGNVDEDLPALRAAMVAAGHRCHEYFGTLEVQDRKIAFTHGDDARRLREAADGGQWDLVCYGHTHVARQERRGRTLLLNPGALYRAHPHSLAVVDLRSMAVTMVTI